MVQMLEAQLGKQHEELIVKWREECLGERSWIGASGDPGSPKITVDTEAEFADAGNEVAGGLDLASPAVSLDVRAKDKQQDAAQLAKPKASPKKGNAVIDNTTPKSQQSGISIEAVASSSSLFSESASRAAKSGFERVEAFVLSDTFECFFGVIIILNCLMLAVQRQIEGIRSKELLEAERGMTVASGLDWAQADKAFEHIEWIFGGIFVSEVLLKIMVLRAKFVTTTFWNVFDSIVVLSWVIDRLRVIQVGLDPTVMRLARLSRLVRLLRILNWSNVFDPLILLVKSIKASLSVLGWSLVLLNVVIIIVALCVSEILDSFIRDQAYDLDRRTEVWRSYGSFSRAAETMFEVTLANWGPHCRLLMNGVNEWWLIFFLLYKFTVGFAVVQVIISVFIQQTLKVASRDEEIMIREKHNAQQVYMGHLEKLFVHLDSSGDGLITHDEFENVLQDKRVVAWLSALEVDLGEVSHLFELLDNGDGEITQDEFFHGIKALKGSAKGTDMLALTRDIRGNLRFMKKVDEKIDRIDSWISRH